MDGAPLERLNFHDGLRLAAADLRVEQAYHMTVRRLLNRALFAPGIAAGLEVAVKPGDPRTVVVSPGVALDERGREIILPREREAPVVGEPSPAEGVVYGNYLVIEHAEAPVAWEEDGCATPSTGPGTGSLSWGGPARLRSEPRLGWRPTWPRPGDGQVVLVQAELSADCAVRRLDHNVRTSVVPRGAERAMAYAIRGKKDLDADNPKDLYFHVRGHRPHKVVLYLRGGLFSGLYYSQLGGHSHPTTLRISKHTKALRHRHRLAGETGPAEPDPTHRHQLRIERGEEAGTVDEEQGTGWNPHLVQLAGGHVHGFEEISTEQALEESWVHDHQAENVVVARTGASDQAATSTLRLRYVDDLRVLIGGSQLTDVTDLICQQLRDRDGPASWGRLGDGSDGHRLVTHGTGEIDLLRLGIDFAPVEHHLRLLVRSGGGRVHYHLHVE